MTFLDGEFKSSVPPRSFALLLEPESPQGGPYSSPASLISCGHLNISRRWPCALRKATEERIVGIHLGSPARTKTTVSKAHIIYILQCQEFTILEGEKASQQMEVCLKCDGAVPATKVRMHNNRQNVFAFRKWPFQIFISAI